MRQRVSHELELVVGDRIEQVRRIQRLGRSPKPVHQGKRRHVQVQGLLEVIALQRRRSLGTPGLVRTVYVALSAERLHRLAKDGRTCRHVVGQGLEGRCPGAADHSFEVVFLLAFAQCLPPVEHGPSEQDDTELRAAVPGSSITRL